MNYKIETAKQLLRIRAVFFRPEQPFIWASGIKSPIYCDNRLTLSDVMARGVVENGLAEEVKTYYPEAEVLMGTSTAGIPHAAIVGHMLGLPMGYVRTSAKEHGRGCRIEGRLLPGQKDNHCRGPDLRQQRCRRFARVLREAGANVLGIVSIFTYGMKSADAFLHSLNHN